MTWRDDLIISWMASMKDCTRSGMSFFRQPMRVSNSTEPMAGDRTKPFREVQCSEKHWDITTDGGDKSLARIGVPVSTSI